MASSKFTDEIKEQLPATTPHYEEKYENANIEHTVIMQEEVNNESNSSMQTESSTVVAEWQRIIEEMRKVENRDGNAVEATSKRALMKQAENEVQTSADKSNNTYEINEEFGIITVENGSARNKRKPKFINHIIYDNINQSASETEYAVQEYFDESEEEPIDLSNRNGQSEILNKQPDEVILSEQHYEERTGKPNNEKVDRPENALSSAKRKRNELELSKLNQKYGNRTFSTFTPSEQQELQHKASNVYEGATFRSFAEFEECLEAYKIVWNYPYRRASSEYLRDSEGRVIDRFKYKYVVFHCAHYGHPRKRGGGKRPNQSYLPLGCEARFRLNADTTNGCLRISSFHEEHQNHGNTEEDYLRVINKKRRNLTEETMPRYDNNDETMLAVNDKNAPEVAENKFTPVASPPGNSIFQISSQENSAFVPVIHPVEMTDQGINQMLQQSIPLEDSILQLLIFTIQLSNRLQRIEYLIMNAYIINSVRYLSLELYLPFVCGICGADYCLSEWSDTQLRNVMALLLQPPEILLQGLLPSDISINEVRQLRPPSIQRAITAIREEKLKKCDKILTPFIRPIFDAATLTDFSVAVGESKKLADDVIIMITTLSIHVIKI
ncbi:unnamed protein product [Cercopithifilaria johnstoni]|uniref:ZSWIM3 N-terminal domain-containing protein n=1 Tax=Cercopithifilaria johnstoni TaxID=2874296 RepID=A0A8J2LZM6_9BILA|nr:unnamed protein product [Cercopithifilaria johnstoni]